MTRTGLNAVGLAGVWLIGLALCNRIGDEAVRHVLAYAFPVAIVAWSRLGVAFVVAGLATLVAWWGGALHHAPSGAAPTPAVLAFTYAKLSMVAMGVYHGARLRRRGGEAPKP